MRNMDTPARRARQAEQVEQSRQRAKEILDEAPPLTEEQARELRPLLLAPNVVTARGKSRGRRQAESSSPESGRSRREPTPKD